MKKIGLFILMLLILLPTSVFAFTAKEDYVSKNLEQTLEAEGIEKEFSNYKETDKQITIYMFRGQGCSFCKSFLKYLNSITDDYGKYFKLESYEVWQDAKNDKLMDEVGEFLGEPAKGVPYIVIGDEVFAGYISDFNEDIEDAIVDLYNESDRYDVFEEMLKEANEPTGATSNTSVIVWNAVIVLLATTAIVGINYHNNKKLNERLDTIEKKIKNTKKDEK